MIRLVSTCDRATNIFHSISIRNLVNSATQNYWDFQVQFCNGTRHEFTYSDKTCFSACSLSLSLPLPPPQAARTLDDTSSEVEASIAGSPAKSHISPAVDSGIQSSAEVDQYVIDVTQQFKLSGANRWQLKKAAADPPAGIKRHLQATPPGAVRPETKKVKYFAQAASNSLVVYVTVSDGSIVDSATADHIRSCIMDVQYSVTDATVPRFHQSDLVGDCFKVSCAGDYATCAVKGI